MRKNALTAPGFSVGVPSGIGVPASVAVDAVDHIRYSIEGSLDLGAFTTAVWPNADMIPAANIAPLSDTDLYEYRSFVLQGSQDLPGKGFLRARVEPTAP